jgi:hypothetical protein
MAGVIKAQVLMIRISVSRESSDRWKPARERLPFMNSESTRFFEHPREMIE